MNDADRMNSIKSIVGYDGYVEESENIMSILIELDRHASQKVESVRHISDQPEFWDTVGRYLYNFNFQVNHAFFISSYAVFDGYLLSLARLLQDNVVRRIKLNDLKANSNLEKYRLFFEALYDSKSFENGREIFDRLKKYANIRDAIIHRNTQLVNSFRPGVDVRSAQGFELLEDYCYDLREDRFKISNIAFISNFQKDALTFMSPLAEDVYLLLKDLTTIRINHQDFVFQEDGGVLVVPLHRGI